ncbi:MAG: M15 family metallopeptidase [Candidatus Fimenecus sp.]
MPDNRSNRSTSQNRTGRTSSPQRSTDAQRAAAARRARAKKKKQLIRRRRILAALSVIFVFTVIICGAYAVKKSRNKQIEYSPSEVASSSSEISSQQTEKNTTPSVSESDKDTTSKKADSVNPTVTTTSNPLTGSFYDGITYCSPTAKPADIFKHGRNLMLLNNDYELPENFKWDLVYWSNGQSVDALSLNSSKYDSVKAVDRAAYTPLKNLFQAASDAGVPLQLVSAYRSPDLQDRLFTRSVNSYISQGYSKQEAIKKANYARTFSGTSEHNTGLGFDILQQGNFTLGESFENTAQFKWLSQHAEEYGFILRYRKDKTTQTGIMYEPWHFRYVGVEHAKKINELDMCLEEYIAYLES